MTHTDAPILIAYDGSDTAGRAIREAAKLFRAREVLVVTVWEPALAYGTEIPMAGVEMSAVPIDVEGAQEIEEELHEQARRVTAQAGAELAQSVGLQAKGLAVADKVQHSGNGSSRLPASERSRQSWSAREASEKSARGWRAAHRKRCSRMPRAQSSSFTVTECCLFDRLRL